MCLITEFLPFTSVCLSLHSSWCTAQSCLQLPVHGLKNNGQEMLVIEVKNKIAHLQGYSLLNFILHLTNPIILNDVSYSYPYGAGIIDYLSIDST